MDYETFLNRIKSLYDDGVFMQLGAFFDEANVITGYGTVGERLVYAYCQCGPVNVAHAAKITSMYKMALKMGAPVVAFLDSKGISLDEGVSVMSEYGEIFQRQTEAKGVIPQISVITGGCVGTAAYIAGLSDFIFMSGKDSSLMLTSPNTLDGIDGKTTSISDFGKDEVDLLCEIEADCIKEVRKLIGLIPSNNLEEAYMNVNARPVQLSPEENDSEKIIRSVLDGDFFELKKAFSSSVKTGLGTIKGRSVGIIFVSDEICCNASDKIQDFVKFCNSFNLPVITFTDIKGYKSTLEEQRRMIRSGAKLLTAFADTSIAKINVITGNAVGSAYLIMNSKQIGCDIVYAWKNANISLFPKEAYKIINPEDSLKDAAKKGLVDDIIEPDSTRAYLIAALEMLASKRV